MAVKKQRIDKYYNLAKEKGYRSRAAFKLKELNRKYRFLNDTHIAVDLCAAPGGWMQVLLEEMPQPRKVIGIDLDPIKPLGIDSVSFMSDITTIECRKRLIELLDGNEADIFVHDGAPNFGTSKEKDIFVQNDLVLKALKLSCEFLKKNGVFITKIFRSENFLKITNILRLLFEKVNITKPLSSRTESAEIFAVCMGYKSTEEIDANMFDSNVVFAEEEKESDLYKKTLLSDFIKAKDNKLLYESGSIVVDFECPLITDNMKSMFEDLKLVHPLELKKICQKKNQIVKGVITGKFDIEILNELKPFENESTEEDEVEENKLEELERKMKKMERAKKAEEKKINNVRKEHVFYEDRIFEDFDSKECEPVDNENIEEIEVSSCSDSLSMTESEMRYIIQMKEEGIDKFEGDTIDRYLVDDDDIVLENEKRSLKINTPKIEKKKVEMLSRKNARAARRANKKIQDIVVENEEDEAIIYKKIFKNTLKRERSKIRLMFGKKIGDKFKKPKGKGRILLVDRRMKHDLRLEKKRKRLKKR